MAGKLFEELEVGQTKGHAYGGRGPPGKGAEAGKQLLHVERFGQVVVGAAIEAGDAVRFVSFRREHDDRCALATGAQTPADGEAVLAGQHQVEDDHVDVFLAHHPFHCAAAGDGMHAETLFGEIAVQQIAQALVVVYYQDVRGCGVHVGSSRIQDTRIL